MPGLSLYSVTGLELRVRNENWFSKSDYRLMPAICIAFCRILQESSAILYTFIKLPFVFKTFVLSIIEWLLKTGFTVLYFWPDPTAVSQYLSVFILPQSFI